MALKAPSFLNWREGRRAARVPRARAVAALAADARPVRRFLRRRGGTRFRAFIGVKVIFAPFPAA